MLIFRGLGSALLVLALCGIASAQELRNCTYSPTQKNYSNCSFREAQLAEADFSNANLMNSDLVRADLFKANFTGANLNGVNLNGANLMESNFSNSDLTGASLSFSNLSNANFTNANMTFAYLYRATIFDTILKEAKLAGTIWEDGVRCKEESKGECLATQANDKITTLYVMTDARQGAANEDGTGLYVDILREIYENQGIQTKVVVAPYSRAVRSIQQKQVDCMLGVPLKSVEEVTYSKVPIDENAIFAMFNKTKITDWKGVESLSGKRLGWLRGLGYDKYLQIQMEKNELNNRKSGFGMLQKDRLDFFLDNEADLKHELSNTPMDMTSYRIEQLMKNALYVSFADNLRGEQLRQMFDENFAQLVKSGKLQKVYQNWKWHYIPAAN